MVIMVILWLSMIVYDWWWLMTVMSCTGCSSARTKRWSAWLPAQTSSAEERIEVSAWEWQSEWWEWRIINLNQFNGSDVSWYEKCPVQLQELRCRLFAKLSNGELWGVRQFESANGKLTGRILSCRSKGIDAGRPVCQIALWQRQLSHGWITSLSHS